MNGSESTPEHEVEPIPDGAYMPNEEKKPEPLGILTMGGRVEHRSHPGRLGTVTELSGRGVRVDWDMLFHETIEHPADLRPDAPMPDPAFALAKALRYRRQRDAALTDLAALAGIELDAQTRVGEALRERDDARADAELAVIRETKARKIAERERDIAERDLARQAEHIQALERIIEKAHVIASEAGTYDVGGNYRWGDDALNAIVELTGVDEPTDSVGE